MAGFGFGFGGGRVAGSPGMIGSVISMAAQRVNNPQRVVRKPIAGMSPLQRAAVRVQPVRATAAMPSVFEQLRRMRGV